MDILDLLKPRDKMFCSGEYRKKENSEPEYFEYTTENNKTAAYAMLIQNIASGQKNAVIRTAWALEWKDRGFVKTQDGEYWQVNDYTTEIKRTNENVLRILKTQPSQEYIISLIGVENPQQV